MMIMNGGAGCRQTRAATCWSFVLEALDYGARSGQRPRVGHICRSALLVSLLLALTPRLPVWLAGVLIWRGPPWTRWLTRVSVGPGRSYGG